MKCIPGYYCSAGCSSSRPRSVVNDKGDLCPVGHYCLIESGKTVATATGTKCPAGTYNDGVGNKALNECHTCPNGFTCEGTGLLFANIVTCPVKKYCGQGLTAVSAATPCTAGNYCPAGSKEPIPCLAGFYQPDADKDSCLPCAAPFFCPFMTNVSSQVAIGGKKSQKTNCSFGHKCADAKMQTAEPCPEGYHQDTEGQTTCTPCPVAKYCPY